MIATYEWLYDYCLGPHRPIVVLHLWLDCPLHCPICYVRRRLSDTFLEPRETLSPEALERVVAFAEKKDACLYIGTGEPFIWDKYWGYIKTVLFPTLRRHPGARLVLSTSGTPLVGGASAVDILTDMIQESADTEFAVCFSVDEYHTAGGAPDVTKAIKTLAAPEVRRIKVYTASIVEDGRTADPTQPPLIPNIPLQLDHNYNVLQPHYFHDRNGKCKLRKTRSLD